MRLLALLAALLTFDAVASERPNIVFIFSDDHATNAISAYGGRLKDVAPTPNLDRIADQGAIFPNSFCSNSICGPSRAAILTGKHSHINGYVDNNNSSFDGSQTTFPKLLRDAGYQTALVGKWHLKSTPRGFDYWEILPGQGSYYNPVMLQQGGGRKRYEGYCTDIVTDRALKWLEEDRDSEKPFILMCQHKAPHRNWSPALRHADLFDDVEIPEPETLFDDYANRSETLKEQEMSIAEDFHWGHDMKFKGENLLPEHFKGRFPNGEYGRMTPEQKKAWDEAYGEENRAFVEKVRAGEIEGRDVTRWKYQRYIKDYLRCIRAVDENVGRVMSYLEENGLEENTIVIYSSDQGFFLGEHGWYDKRWMFEESLEMPFLIRWPGVIEPGSRGGAMIQNIDYAPTFLELAGAEVPEEIQGRSLVPVLERSGEAPEDWREAIYYYYSGERTHGVAAHDGVRSERHKLMYFPGTDEWNLFDLEEDPKELRSVAGDPGYADVLERMKTLYRDLRGEYEMNPATLPAHRNQLDWWRERREEKLAEVEEGGHELVFIGDSITQGWEGPGREVWDEFYGDYETLNLGYSGDRTEHVLWRMLNGELEGVDPEAYVLMIGTNNTGHRQDPPEVTATGIELIVEMLRDRSPESEILLCGVFPRGEEPDDELRVINVGINERIRKLGDRERVHFMSFTDTFLAEDGTLPEEIMPDFLHPETEGYRLWAEAMQPKLEELMAE